MSPRRPPLRSKVIDGIEQAARAGERGALVARLRRLRVAEYGDGLSEGYRFAMRQAAEHARSNRMSHGGSDWAHLPDLLAWLDQEARRS